MTLLWLPLAFAVTLVAGTASTYTDGVYTWAGNPACAEAGFLLSPESPAIDAGIITEIHCKQPGTALTQPRLSNGDTCQEWYGKAPDIGACEFFVPVPNTNAPSAPSGLTVK